MYRGMWPEEHPDLLIYCETFQNGIYERVAVLRGVEDGETPKQGPLAEGGGRRSSPTKTRLKVFRNPLDL